MSRETNKEDDLNGNVDQNSTLKNTLETFKFPPVWADDERMAELMSAFRLRDVNPMNYDSKMRFWQELIASFCTHKGAPTFSKRELQLAFVRGKYLPYSLDTVIEDMLLNKKIRLRREYVYDPLNSWSSWAIQAVVRRPLFWGIHKIRSSLLGIDPNSPANVQYVHLDVMKKFCKDLQAVMADLKGKLMHLEAFKKHLTACVNAPKLTEQSLLLCLQTLHSQRKVGLEYIVENDERQLHLIKIPLRSDSNPNITEEDHSIHNLQMTQTNILRQLEDIAEEVKINHQKARQCLNEGKRQLAKTYLRKKHILEQNHEKRSIALQNIEALIISVNDAQCNGEILDAYKIGAKALQKTLNDAGLKYDNVDEVISSMADGIEMQQEVQHSLATINLGEGECDDDLERELEAILGENADAPSDNQSQQAQNHNIILSTPQKQQTDAITTINETLQKQKVSGTTISITPRNLKVDAAGTVIKVTSENKHHNNNNSIAPTQVNSRTIEISDADLLAMLEELEVEDNSLPNAVIDGSSMHE